MPLLQIARLIAMTQRGVPVVLCMWGTPDATTKLPCIAVDFGKPG